ncbi:hypothetical protein J3R82DRAFT_2065 [Butyriboletus roseoflavus]|nr:hypothetical protein J3R82DRAFT_2065 [Butyriboletus roseoflavus]
MSKTFSCDVDNCGSVFTKKSDLKKHNVEHEDPSKLLRCTKHDCKFSTLYRRGLETHRNSHSNARPYACPDMVKDPASSATPGGRSARPSISEKQCTFRSNCPSALLKHRVTHHNYKTHPRAWRSAPKDPRARSPGPSLPKKRFRAIVMHITTSSQTPRHPLPFHPHPWKYLSTTTFILTQAQRSLSWTIPLIAVLRSGYHPRFPSQETPIHSFSLSGPTDIVHSFSDFETATGDRS